MISFRALICLVAVSALGVGAAHADGLTPVNKTAAPAHTPVCARTFGATAFGATTFGATAEQAASKRMRLAFACRCCGWENWNGHKVCVHQCCD